VGLEGAILAGLMLSCGLAYAATPIAIRIAGRLEFYDRPGGYKGHGRLTPYLGGSAVMVGFLLAVVPLAGGFERSLPIVGGIVLMWAVGTLDDRRHVAWFVRLALEAALAAMLFAFDLGWHLGAGAGLDFVATLVWVAAVVNALNLFDNMDGQAATMAFVISGALAVLGAIEGDRWLAVTAAALCGASLGFLPHNLARPARIFLGDGGSMPIGFALAALVMAGAGSAAPAWQALAIGLLLVGVPALDSALVTISRRRRGIPLLTGGRDHLTHRARRRLRNAQAVAVALGSAQALLAALALAASRGNPVVIVSAVAVFLAAAGVLIAILDAPHRRADDRDDAPQIVAVAPVAADDDGPRPLALEALLLVPLGILFGLSPLAEGYYGRAAWAPAGLVLIVLLVGAAIMMPPLLRPRAWLALVAMSLLGVLSLASALWADSVAQAFVEGGRFVVYAVLMALLLVLVRGTAQAVWLISGFALAAWALAAVVMADLVSGGGADLFLGPRLNEPLGYVNAQGSFFALALWPAIALAERRRAAVAGVGAAIGVVLIALALLTVSRGVAAAVLASILVVVLAVPGRLRRVWLLLALGAATAALAGPAHDVYASGVGRASVDPDLLADVAVRALVAAAVVGVVWGLLTALAERPLARALRTPAIAVLAAGALAVAAVGVANSGTIGGGVERQWDAFVTLGAAEGGEATGSRLVSGAGNRYDYWRIALDAWQRDPAGGVGAGGYHVVYLRERSTPEDVRQPHSLVLQLLAETGLAGAVLLIALVAAVGAGLRRSARRARAGGAERTVTVAAAGLFAVWLAHASVDWMHLLPGLTGAALAGAVILLRRAPGEGDRPPGYRPSLVVGVAVALTLAGILLGREVVAQRLRAEAIRDLAADPARALRQADRALRLDAEALPAYYTRAAALARFGRAEQARAALVEATRREPENFLTYALLGDLAVRMGDGAEAERRYAQALARNPLEPSLRRQLEELAS